MRNPYIYIFLMAIITYLIRVLPLTLIRKEIKNKTIRSFLYYVPYVTLAVMTFPSILGETQSVISALAALIVAIALAFFVGVLVAALTTIITTIGVGAIIGLIIALAVLLVIAIINVICCKKIDKKRNYC